MERLGLVVVALLLAQAHLGIKRGVVGCKNLLVLRLVALRR
jgi:hypothetical protein